jgi:hypothetical protein
MHAMMTASTNAMHRIATEREIIMSTTLTVKEAAARIETDARTLRKFLRSDANTTAIAPVGKGARYAIEAKVMRSLTKQFQAWDAARTPADAPADGVDLSKG